MDKLNLSDTSFDLSLNICRFKIVFVGDVSVGKSSIINRINENPFKEEYEPSIGVDFFSKTIIYKEKSIKLQIWDSAGQEKYRALIPNYIRGSSIVFLIYDITNQDSFDNLNQWIEFINNNEKTNIVLIGNKCDLNDKRVIEFEKGKQFAEENKLLFFETSAKTLESLRKMLFTSVASLSYFEQFNESIEDIVNEMEKDSNYNDFHTNRSPNFSIIEMAKGTSRINDMNDTKSEDDINMNLKKKCKCKC